MYPNITCTEKAARTAYRQLKMDGDYIPCPDQGRAYLDSPLLDSLSNLDILYANECETSQVPEDFAVSTEAYFYRGGQVKWLNFHLAEREMGPNRQVGLSFIKREGYERITELVNRQRSGQLSMSSIDLFHEPGSGGTTLAMQVLWDFRKKLRCAVLRDSEAKAQDVARQVIDLFRAGGKQNTILLLIDDLPRMERDLMECVSSSRVGSNIPVVIVLNCVRIISGDSRIRNGVTLRTKLSTEEQNQFVEKEAQVRLLHREQSEGFHGLNLMRHNFSKEYMQRVLDQVLEGLQPTAQNTQLLSFLALLNSYVPGSSLLKSECQAFLGPPAPIDGGPSFENRMEPFTGLLITFTRREKLVSYDLVRMAHPLIATYCCQALDADSLKLSKMTKSLLMNFDKEQRDKMLVSYIKDLLVKRTTGAQFSPLIENIKRSNKNDCVLILESACRKFPRNAFIPQALARFLYLIKQDYTQAEKWANEAIRIMPNNSFIVDTLGQLHKNHLKYENPENVHTWLKLAQKAVAAFENQQKVAEKEDEAGLKDAHSIVRKSDIFNHRGLFGHMQVASIVFDMLSGLHPAEDMKRVLTLEAKVESLHNRVTNETYQTLLKFKNLIISFRDKVERSFIFFECYLTYSRGWNYDPLYIREQVTRSFLKYVTPVDGTIGGIHRELKKKTAASFPGLLHCLYQKNRRARLTEIMALWNRIVHSRDCATSSDVLCYLLSNIALSCVHPESPHILPFTELTSTLSRLLMEKKCSHEPELYFLALMLLWPNKSDSRPSQGGGQENHPGDATHDINVLVRQLEKTYEKRYQKHLRSRNILPHFFLKEGTEYSRLVHRSTIDLWLSKSNKAKAKDETQESGKTLSYQNHTLHQRKNQSFWRNDEVKGHLLQVQGVIKDREVFACYGQLEVLVHPDFAAQVRSPGSVVFYLGFNMRGPVAFDIKYSSGPIKPPSKD